MRFLLSLGLASCGTGATLDSTGEDRKLFHRDALSAYAPEDRAYVMGHALGVYLYARTLPAWLESTGFVYEPGRSSETARVGYSYAAIVADRAPPPADVPAGSECYFDNLDDYVCPGDGGSPPGPIEPEDPTGDPSDPMDPTDPIDPADDPSGSPPRDEPRDPGEPIIDEDCESFLDPAALTARALRAHYDSEAMLSGELGEVSKDDRHGFELGFADSLALEDLDEETDFSEAYAMQEESQDADLCDHSPLILDLAGDGVRASAPEDGVFFDLRETGLPVRTAWPHGDDVLLAMDRNGDRLITSGGELFGNAIKPGGRHANGFAMLAELDRPELGGNDDGIVDAEDAGWSELLLWGDANRDGVSQDAELQSLVDAGILGISTDSKEKDLWDPYGNRLGVWGSFTFVDADRNVRASSVVDVWFRFQHVSHLGDQLLARVKRQRTASSWRNMNR
jgi:hypothetical protein